MAAASVPANEGVFGALVSGKQGPLHPPPGDVAGVDNPPGRGRPPRSDELAIRPGTGNVRPAPPAHPRRAFRTVTSTASVLVQRHATVRVSARWSSKLSSESTAATPGPLRVDGVALGAAALGEDRHRPVAGRLHGERQAQHAPPSTTKSNLWGMVCARCNGPTLWKQEPFLSSGAAGS